MPELFHYAGQPAFAWVGAVVLVTCMALAFTQRQNIFRLLLFMCLADAGYLIAGIGSAQLAGQSGAVLQLVFTGTARLLSFYALLKLKNFAGSADIHALKGIGRAKPVTSALFALGMFAALGVSPFLTPDAKPLILYALLSSDSLLKPVLMVCGSLGMMILTVLTAHAVWLAHGKYERKTDSSFENIPGLLLATVLAGLGIFGHKVLLWTTGLISANDTLLPDFVLGWHLSALVPYAGAPLVWLLGKFSKSGRNLLACTLMAAAVYFAFAHAAPSQLGSIFTIMVTGIGLLVTIYSCGYIKDGHIMSEDGYYLFLLLLFGSLAGIATAANLGGFYVFWELMTLTSYILVAWEDTPQAHKAALKYFIMCSAGAAIMLPGLLLLSTHFGTLELSALMHKASTLSPATGLLIALLVLTGFAVKAGLVPGHAWLPDAHPAAPSSISAPLSGILTKAGIFGLAQLLLGVFGAVLITSNNGMSSDISNLGGATGLSAMPSIPSYGIILSALGLCTMLYGEIMALRQSDIKRLFAYSTMGQIGEITMTLGLCTWLAATGALMHMVNHAIMKDLLFLCSGALILRAGTRELNGLKGLGRVMPFTATCMVIGLISILGLPPFGGFMSKYLMLTALASVNPLLAAMMLLASLAGCVYYMRIIRVLIFEPYTGAAVKEAPWSMRLPLAILALFCVLQGLLPQFSLNYITSAVNSLTGNLVIGTLPLLQIKWAPYTIILMAGALLPILLRKNPVAAGRGTALLLAVSAIMVPFFSQGLDTLSLIIALVIPSIGALNMYYSSGYMAHSHTQWRFYTFFLFMCAGLTGVAASRDLFNFFFFWEIMSSWSLYFVIVHEENAAALREGFKYFFFNVLGAAFLFLGVVLLSLWAGSPEFGQVHKAISTFDNWQIALAFGLLATGFVMKAAQLPFRIDIQMHPSTAPTPVSGYISSVLLKSAIFGLAKLFLVLGGSTALTNLYGVPEIMTIVVWVGGITIVMAALLAVFQSDLKLVLIYSTVSQLGYMVVAIALGTSLGVSGGLLHLLNHVLFKNLLFLVAGAVLLQTGRHSVNGMGGLGLKMPLSMLFFAIGAVCVIGVPPSNGFTSKWIIYHALMEQGHVLVAILSLVGSVLTLAYFAKLMHSVFLGQLAAGLENVQEAPKSMTVPMGILAAGCVVTSIFPGLLLAPLNMVLTEFSLPQLNIALWGIASGAGAWNATAIFILFAAAWLGGWIVLRALTGKRRVNPIHTCGILIEELNVHTTTRDIYSVPNTPSILKKIKSGFENDPNET